ncbi:hypothetical protein [Bacillus rhizoplanae]
MGYLQIVGGEYLTLTEQNKKRMSYKSNAFRFVEDILSLINQ